MHFCEAGCAGNNNPELCVGVRAAVFEGSFTYLEDSDGRCRVPASFFQCCGERCVLWRVFRESFPEPCDIVV